MIASSNKKSSTPIYKIPLSSYLGIIWFLTTTIFLNESSIFFKDAVSCSFLVSDLFPQEKINRADNKNNDNNGMNTYIKDNVKLEINTIHGVKGETHLATLYLDTFWYKYDISYYLIKLLSSELTNKQKNDIQNTKRNRNIFVGASRSQYLLCFACKKINISDKIKDMFEIIEI